MASAPIRDQAGGVPIGWVALECELQPDWNGWRRCRRSWRSCSPRGC
jgi:hypothetical protein